MNEKWAEASFYYDAIQEKRFFARKGQVKPW